MPVVSAGHELSCFANISTVFMVITLKKCPDEPDEPGELEAKEYGVPSLAGDAGFTAQRHRNGALL